MPILRIANILFTSIILLLIHGVNSFPVGLESPIVISKIHLTPIGKFGLKRKARNNIPEHYHTGIDIQRSNNNYDNEPIFPIAKGILISKRTDGAYANIIIEHENKNLKFWTLYEHVAGIKVKVNDLVSPNDPIARFMNKEELNHFGWQFDHYHLEVIKIRPSLRKPDKNQPENYFSSYTLSCYTLNDLHKYYFDPMEFIQNNLTN